MFSIVAGALKEVRKRPASAMGVALASWLMIADAHLAASQEITYQQVPNADKRITLLLKDLGLGVRGQSGPSEKMYASYFRWLETGDEYIDFWDIPGQG